MYEMDKKAACRRPGELGRVGTRLPGRLKLVPSAGACVRGTGLQDRVERFCARVADGKQRVHVPTGLETGATKEAKHRTPPTGT